MTFIQFLVIFSFTLLGHILAYYSGVFKQEKLLSRDLIIATGIVFFIIAIGLSVQLR